MGFVWWFEFFNLLPSVMADDDDPVEAERVTLAVAVLLKEEREERKLERLQRAAKAAQRKALKSKRLLEEESRKRARSKVTISKYLLTSRNADNPKGAVADPIEGERVRRGSGKCIGESWWRRG